MSQPIRIGIVGVGKIVRDQHLPALAQESGLSPRRDRQPKRARSMACQSFTTIEEMLDAVKELDAVSLCMPPQFRYDAARHGTRGRQARLPGEAAGRHGQRGRGPEGAGRGQGRLAVCQLAFALCAGGRGRASLSRRPTHPDRSPSTGRKTCAAGIPSQDWIWQAGGFGVFDPGINALSIATHILPKPMFVTSAMLDFPENRARADRGRASTSATPTGLPVTMELDWRQTGPQSWDIVAETDNGRDGAVGRRRETRRRRQASSTTSRRRNTRCSTGASPRSSAPAISDVDLAPLQPCRRCLHARQAQGGRGVLRLTMGREERPGSDAHRTDSLRERSSPSLSARTFLAV